MSKVGMRTIDTSKMIILRLGARPGYENIGQDGDGDAVYQRMVNELPSCKNNVTIRLSVNSKPGRLIGSIAARALKLGKPSRTRSRQSTSMNHNHRRSRHPNLRPFHRQRPSVSTPPWWRTESSS